MSVRLDALRAQRISAGLTVSQLAHLANIGDLTIDVLETVGTNGEGGATSHDIADKICAALGIDRTTCGFTDIG